MVDIAMTYLGQCQTSLIKIFWEESLNHCYKKAQDTPLASFSRLQMFFKIGVVKYFAKFTGKHLC